MPPKFSVYNRVGFLKGKSAIQIFRKHEHAQRNFSGRHFWAWGCCVSKVGLNEKMIQEYIMKCAVKSRCSWRGCN
ncbi:transposase [Microbulbifer sp. CnH-101-G]|uniref:transposase n=1 Tax=Microbulbifer sp. CnH-101-G TaxID=3243393 RepID=UPI00403A2503